MLAACVDATTLVRLHQLAGVNDIKHCIGEGEEEEREDVEEEEEKRV